MKKIFLIILAVSPILSSSTLFRNNAGPDKALAPTIPPFIEYNSAWTDSVFNTLTLEEKVGQLFMIPVYPNQSNQSKTDLYISKYKVGGIIYFKGHPTRVAELTNHFQSISKTPLMTAIDGEWGVGMRFDSVVVFPHQLMLGAIDNNHFIYEMGKQIALQCKALGININFAPVVDINNNPKNPVIGVRSFGEDKIKVAQKGYAYALGMQDENVLAVAKHFPGHGDTDVDSHKDLPIIKASAERLDTLEMFPFKQLINAGIGGVMMAHLDIPSLDNTKNLPSSLSKKITDKILKKRLGFQGLIFTDALGMQGVAKYHKPGKAEILALQAGVDILLMSDNIDVAYPAVLKAVKTGKISQKLLDEKVKKIIQAKYWMNLNNFQKIDLENLTTRLNTPDMQLVNRQLVESALTLVKNTDSIIPIKKLEAKKIASVSVGSSQKTVFQDYLLRYAQVENFQIAKSASAAEFNKLQQKLANYDLVIIGVHNTNQYAVKTYGITSQTLQFIANVADKQKVILDLFGNPYALKRFRNIDKMAAVLVSYEDTKVSQELSAQLLFGGIPAKGKLPVSVTTDFQIGNGLQTSQIRLKYSIPNELNINYDKLHELDNLIYSSIGEKAFPGCQIMAIKNGVVFFQKEYGYHTYKMREKVKWNDVYDLASITKIASTTTALMKLYEQKKFNIYNKMSVYLPELDTTNKSHIRALDVLTHQARLKSWIPFYTRALNRDGSWNKKYLSKKKSENYSVEVARNVYVNKNFQDKLFKVLYSSQLNSRKRYRYSDLGFYLFKKIIEQQTGTPLDKYVKENFYNSLGAYSLCYRPLQNGISTKKIPPTEYDFKFRNQLVHGYVHDYGAAILGGVGGHAGLFSSANDLAKLLQMFLQKGQYAEVKYLNKNTLELFTKKPFPNNRRAIGFDATDGNGVGPACGLSTDISYGHTGFTGCMVWIDPAYNFIYIFLSNRIYPDIENKKILEKNVREKSQLLLYQSFLNYSNTK